MKKIFTLIAAMLLVPWVGWGQGNWIDDANTSWYDENENTFEISTAEELAGLAKLVNEGNNFSEKTIVLAKDIILNKNVLNAEKQLNSGYFKNWTPIGNENNSFLGSFDGNNKKIIGCYINNITSTYHIGLFGKGKNIKNLEVIDSYINVEDLSDLRCIGGIVGYPYSGNIINCSFDGIIQVSVTGNLNSNALSIGGICGIPYTTGDESNIESCYNKSDIQVSLNDINMGMQTIDIAGVGIPNGKIVNSYNRGNINVKVNSVKTTDQSSGMSPVYVSGIGRAYNITSCYNVGNITVSESENANNTALFAIGGVSAYSSYSNTIKYCYNYGEINSTITTTGSSWLLPKAMSVGNIVGTGGSYGIATFETNYCLSQTDLDIVGSVASGTTIDNASLIEKTEDPFKNGEVAYELRKAGAKYGQLQNNPNNDATPVLLAFEENKGKEVYKRTLDYSKYEGNATEATELEDYVNSGNLWLPELNENEGWYDAKGNLYTNESTLSPDIFEITLYAEAQTPHTITISEMEGGKVEANETTAIKGETITLTVTPNEGYNYIDESLTVKAGEETITVTPGENGTYTFIMPNTDVTVSATFAEKLYTVTIEDCVGGTATIDGESHEFAADATVALSIKADEGYKFSHIVYTYDGGSQKSEQTTFTMPASNVTVEVFFVAGDDEEGDGAGTTLKRYRLYLADQDFYLNDEYDEAGLVLYSRHDKKYTDVGGSFTIWFEKNGEVNEGARVFISNRANGEYKEVKLNEVSGYYQIRNVQSNIYVKLYTEEGFPVANESIEATDARAYAQANKIVVITPEPTDVQIISMAGAVVATAQVAGQQEFANLAEGVYIVRMGKEILKLQVRN